MVESFGNIPDYIIYHLDINLLIERNNGYKFYDMEGPDRPSGICYLAGIKRANGSPHEVIFSITVHDG